MCSGRVRVVIPVYNGSEYLRQALEGVAAQSHSDWRMTIVDDGSTDGSGDIARSVAAGESRISVIRQENQGIAAARNRGAMDARTDEPYLAFLDQDDVWDPDALTTLVSLMEEHPRAAAAYGAVRLIGPDGKRTPESKAFEAWVRNRLTNVGASVRPLSPDRPTTTESLVVQCGIPTVGLAVVRSRVFQELSGFDSGCEPADDWDLWLRASLVGDIVFSPRIVLSYRVHGGNVSRNQGRMGEAEKQVLKKLFRNIDDNQELRTRVQKAYRAGMLLGASHKLRNAAASLRRGHFGDTARELARCVIRCSAAARGWP